jgi:hypothetical protein
VRPRCHQPIASLANVSIAEGPDGHCAPVHNRVTGSSTAMS